MAVMAERSRRHAARPRPATLESIPRQEATGVGRYAERRMKRRFTFCTGRAFIG
jgi:hypothetical protein